jgi:hypothetical protein
MSAASSCSCHGAKYDQDARDTRLWLPRGRTDLCPGKALEALN